MAEGWRVGFERKRKVLYKSPETGVKWAGGVFRPRPGYCRASHRLGKRVYGVYKLGLEVSFLWKKAKRVGLKRLPNDRSKSTVKEYTKKKRRG